jgi:tetratricopeptide (TPR) repeat protein
MIRRIILAAALIGFLGTCSCAQSPNAPMSKSEIFGRLALDYSPSYLAHLIRTRGISFVPSEHFLSLVRLAGGDGILVERISSTDTPLIVNPSESDRPFESLAKCAELIHIGAAEHAEKECHDALEESPDSSWPIMAAIRAFAESDMPQEEHLELLRRAAALNPKLAIVHRSLAMADVSPQERDEEMQKVAALERDPAAEPPGTVGAFKGDSSFRGASEARVLTPEAEEQIRLHIQSLLQEDPELAMIHLSLAFDYNLLGKQEKAQSELGEALRLEPDNPELHNALANLFHFQHNLEAELAEYREAIRIAPFQNLQRRSLVDALVREQRSEEAICEWKNFLALAPGDVAASNFLINLYLEQHDRKSAIAELRRSLKVSSLTFTDHPKFVDTRFQDLERLANILKENHELDSSAEQYLFLLRSKPDSAELHNDYGNVLLDQRRLDEAIHEYSEAFRLDPEMSTAHRNIGVCLALKKNLDGAITEFRQALELNPEEPRTQVPLGFTLGQKGDLNAAMEQFQQAIEKNPNDPEAHMGLAQALELLKDTSAAISELKLALELQPDSPTAENNLAWIYATADDVEFRNPTEALALASRAVKSSLQPNPAFLNTLAEALLLNGRPTEALDTELQAVRLDPQNFELRSRLPRFQAPADGTQLVRH